MLGSIGGNFQAPPESTQLYAFLVPAITFTKNFPTSNFRLLNLQGGILRQCGRTYRLPDVEAGSLHMRAMCAAMAVQ